MGWLASGLLPMSYEVNPCRLLLSEELPSAFLAKHSLIKTNLQASLTFAEKISLTGTSACASCSHRLEDADIRSVGRDALRELILSRQANHDQSNELQSRLTSLERMQRTNDSFSTPEDMLRGLPQPLASEGHGHGQARWCEELFRSFDFIVVKYPYPASPIHLASIPKTSMYDVKQLRRSHIPLLESMKDKLTSMVNLMIDLLVITSRRRAPRLRASSPAQSICTAPTGGSEGWKDQGGEAAAPMPAKDARMQLRQLVAFGFNYPSEYSQLCLHAVGPPVANFGLFEPPYFYPLKKVLSDLEHRGSVQTFAPSAMLCPDDSFLQTAMSYDNHTNVHHANCAGTRGDQRSQAAD
ncbi:hypothetical protein Esti_000097 [Eimeria stiedai]